ncbi:MAG: helix-turn-helix domain-containing protein [Desulfovibrio sp.]|nr:helix-turn-helix domain-containing protein [Desulfovibrio sp.]
MIQGHVKDERFVLITEKQASEATGINLKTLRKWRYFNIHLPYIKIGRSVRYRLSDIRAYIDKMTIQPRES